MSDDEDSPDSTESGREHSAYTRPELVHASSLLSDRIINDEGEEFVRLGDEYRPAGEVDTESFETKVGSEFGL
jgi:hypothetical protein